MNKELGPLCPTLNLVLGEISVMNTGKLCVTCSLIVFRIAVFQLFRFSPF